MEHVFFFAALLAAAACVALLEIQIEGPHGWAQRLPTWRLQSPLWTRLFPGRPLTGYHLYLLLFILLVAHLPFAFGLPWTWYREARAVAFVLLFWVAEDFLWFVLNPHYGLRRFSPRHIAWHRHAWWWLAPRDYWIAASIGVVLYYLSRHDPQVIVLASR